MLAIHPLNYYYAVYLCSQIHTYLPFTWENRKFQLEDQIVHTIPFGKLEKIWALICGDAIFLLF